jgi:hypothetical protein
MNRIRPICRRGGAGLALAMGLFVVVGAPAGSSPSGPGERSQATAAPTKAIDPAPAGWDRNASELVVHEWGTFLGMNGSDGSALDGMYHEEHALPSFVHTRARDQLRLPIMLLKGETPVIYFYTPRPVQVRVGVGFPQGVWTQWYPQAAVVRPSVVEQAESPDRLRGGRICWFADVIPPAAVPTGIGKEIGAVPRSVCNLPATSSDALWNFARDVDAAYVKTTDGTDPAGRAEYEKFLFYRGLGQARLPLQAHAARGGTLALDRDPTLGAGVRHLFVLRVEQGRGVYQYRPGLRPGEEVTGVIPSLDQALPLDRFARALADELAARLTESGLYAKEARAMVNTWSHSYFRSDGIRVLFVLPKSWTDAFIPMTIVPRPQQVVRVMVGRLELLSPERERLAEAAVGDLAGPDQARRHRAFQYLREQGRYVEPIVRRIARTTANDEMRTLCRRLLTTEFVTELRATIHHADDGKRINPDVTQLRAHLARLLRELGLAAEARAESVALWQDLRSRPEAPDRAEAEDPYALELRGAFWEAIGDDGRAAETYARRIENYVKSLQQDVPPGTITWMRDWWVGRAYAQCLVRAGKAQATIHALQETLSRPIPSAERNDSTGERLPRVLLPLLLDAQGQRDQASSLVLRP